MGANFGVLLFLICARLPRRKETGIHYKLVRCSHHRHGAGYKLTSALWRREVSKPTSYYDNTEENEFFKNTFRCFCNYLVQDECNKE